MCSPDDRSASRSAPVRRPRRRCSSASLTAAPVPLASNSGYLRRGPALAVSYLNPAVVFTRALGSYTWPSKSEVIMTSAASRTLLGAALLGLVGFAAVALAQHQGHDHGTTPPTATQSAAGPRRITMEELHRSGG